MSKINDLIKKLCPNGVEYNKLKDIGETFTGLSGKCKDDFSNGNSRYITYTNIYNNPAVKLNLDDKVFIKDNEKQNVLKYGDVLIAGSSENMEDSGMISVVCEEPKENIYLNSFCFGFRLNKDYSKKILPGFSKHIFRSANFRSQILSCSFGVTRYNLNKKLFLELTIPIPPIEVQEEIVQILDKFGKLESELESELEARKSQYEFWNRKILNNNYQTIKLKEITEIITKGTTPTSIGYNFTTSGEINFIKIESINNGQFIKDKLEHITKECNEKLNRSKLRENDILFSIAGAIGKTIVVNKDILPANTNQALAIIRINNSNYNIRYINYYLNSVYIKNQYMNKQKGSAQINVSLNDISNFDIPRIPLFEQLKIVSVLDHFEILINDISVGLPAEISARRKQYEYYRNKLLSFEELKNE